MANKTAVVTGGAGFIGSHVIEALLTSGIYSIVISIDDYSTGSADNHIDGAQYIAGNTRDMASILDIVPDVIFHLGEYARVEKSFEDLPKVWNANIPGTFGVLEYCRRHGAKIVYAGSSTKFADGGLGRDQSPYAWTKAINTELVRNYGDWFNMDYAIAYFYNVYGGRERAGPYGTVIAIFADRYARGLPIEVTSPGTQKRNFTHVDDIVSGLLLVGEHGHGDEYGLGADDAFSIIDIAKMFGGEIQMMPERRGNRMEGKLDVRRSRQELNWTAKRSLASYINSLR